MALFGKKRVSCPACDDKVDEDEVKGHLSGHVRQVDDGDYAWDCGCGASGRHASSEGAAAELFSHTNVRHGITVF